jgi:hypothetical protein
MVYLLFRNKHNKEATLIKYKNWIYIGSNFTFKYLYNYNVIYYYEIYSFYIIKN